MHEDDSKNLDEIERLYKKGVRIKDIAKEIGRSSKFVNTRINILKEENRVTPRLYHPGVRPKNSETTETGVSTKPKRKQGNPQDIFTTKIPLEYQEILRALAKQDYGKGIKDIIHDALSDYFEKRKNDIPKALKRYKEEFLKTT
jgi:transposase